MSLSRRVFALSAPALVLVAQAPADLTLDGLFHPTLRTAPLPVSRYAWRPDGSLLETRVEGDKTTKTVVDPRTLQRTPATATEPSKAQKRLIEAFKAEGLSEADAKALLPSLPTSDKDKVVLVEAKGAYYRLDPSGPWATRLGTTQELDQALLSPDGQRVAFLRQNNLCVMDIRTRTVKYLTENGSPTRLNGRLDWVTQEEVYGRGTWRAFWWAPDSQKLAYLSLDVSRTPQFRMTDDRFHPQRPEDLAYPKAGEPNPVTSLGLVNLQGETTWMPSPAANQEILIVRVGFDPKGRLLANWQDRAQTWCELRRHEGPQSTLLVREHNPKGWVEDKELPTFLPDGSFLLLSDRTGHRHIYLHGPDGKEIQPLTQGDWVVRSIMAVDIKGGRIFFEANKDNAIGQDAYVVDLKGGEPRRLTRESGTHRTSLDATRSFLLDSWSSHATPGKTQVIELATGETRVLEDRAAQPAPYRRGEVRMVQVKNRRGYLMDAELLLPPGFDPAKKYPVFHTGYAGPASPTVRDAWNSNAFEHFLAQKGWIVWKCEPESSSNKGMVHTQIIYRQLGKLELEDYEDGMAWLAQQGFADMNRTVIDGWSYGGYMASYAITHSTTWKGAIIGAPVTDYRLYDSIYTERFMGLPRDNAAGYDSTNVNRKAKDVQGRILLMHGLMDENVHPQNSVMFMEALIQGGKDFQFVPLPGTGHSPREPWHNYLRMKSVWSFLQRF